ncbi:hypothetical protein KSP40_PGU003969 [Platanthera guangdongensis]|uniref:Uncharacterized protein n=1 Tax=Platanthera guangdongensis TaxID=2320717 RepID=A0ABR2MTT3_9ASPA
MRWPVPAEIRPPAEFVTVMGAVGMLDRKSGLKKLDGTKSRDQLPYCLLLADVVRFKLVGSRRYYFFLAEAHGGQLGGAHTQQRAVESGVNRKHVLNG